MIDIVSIVCRRDLPLLLLQAHSIARYFDHSGLDRVIYIWNEASEIPDSLRGRLDECLDGIDCELLTAADLGVQREHIAADGWTTQQALKLLAAHLMSADVYLVLDAKNHFVRPSSAEDFLADDGRGIFPLVDLSEDPSYRYCLEYFGVRTQTDAARCVLNVTPFVLRTAVVTSLLATLEKKEGCIAVETFLAHQHKMSEFLAYQAFFLSQGGRICDLYQELTIQREVTFWGATVLNASEFGRTMEILEGGNVNLFSLHWIACCMLSPIQKCELCRWWRGRGLVSTEAEGLRIIDTVARNLSEGDRKYLQKFLGSLGYPQSRMPKAAFGFHKGSGHEFHRT